MNVAVGGTGYFPDDATNPGGKPWLNTSPTVSFKLSYKALTWTGNHSGRAVDLLVQFYTAW